MMLLSQTIYTSGRRSRRSSSTFNRNFSYPQSKLILSFDEKYKDKVRLGDDFFYKIDQNGTELKGKISLIYPSIEVKQEKFMLKCKPQI